MTTDWLQFISLFLTLAGFVIGLGAVTVIDIHGFLGRKSRYWTEATTRTHKVTKPMIWVGILMVLVGGYLFYTYTGAVEFVKYHLILMALLVLNGTFLSFVVSPYMLERERKGKSGELLPASWQTKIAVSLIVSDIGWWGSLVLLALSIVVK